MLAITTTFFFAGCEWFDPAEFTKQNLAGQLIGLRTRVRRSTRHCKNRGRVATVTRVSSADKNSNKIVD